MQFTGKTVEEAIENGLKELGVSKDDADILIIEQPTKGLFGRLKGKAVVDITKTEEEQPKKQAEKPVKNEEANVKAASEFVAKITALMGLNATAEIKDDAETPTIEIVAEDSSVLIGYHGEVLDAIQTLAGAVANIGNKTYKKVVVDCEHFRNKRNDTLIKLAHKLEAKATEMRREVVLEAMTPFDRRIIHTALAESETVTTKSEGKEPNRYVVIVPNDKDEFSTPYNAARNKDRGRNDRRGGRDGRKGGFKGRNDRRPRPAGEKKKTATGFGTYLGNSLKDRI